MLKFSVTGPWQVVDSAHGGSYNIEHCHHPTQGIKKHDTNLTRYLAEHIPFEPINGPDTQYSCLHKAINPHPFKADGLSGFLPPQPFKVPAKLIDISNYKDFWWPTLSELNNDIKEFPCSNEEERLRYFEDGTPFVHLSCTLALRQIHPCCHKLSSIQHLQLLPWHR